MKISMTLLASALASLAAAETAGSKGCGFVETPEFARMTAEMALQEANGDFVESAQPIEADVYFHVVSAGQSVSDGNVPVKASTAEHDLIALTNGPQKGKQAARAVRRFEECL